jgi:tetratricopeptide (TPR) repeat protein
MRTRLFGLLIATSVGVMASIQFCPLDLSVKDLPKVQAQGTSAQTSEIEQLIQRSDNQVDQGQPQVGLKTLEEALLKAQAINDNKSKGVIIHRMGSVHLYNLNDPVKARTYYQQALEIAQALPNPILEGKALVNLGNTYKVEGNYKQAIAFHQKALVVTQQSKDCYVQSVAEEAMAYNYSSDFSRSTSFFEKAAETIQSCGDRSFEPKQKTMKQEAVILNGLGKSYYRLHASSLASLPTSCSSESKNPGSAASYPCLDKGMKSHQRALALAQQIGDKETAITARTSLADILKLRGKNPAGADIPYKVTAENQALNVTAQKLLEDSIQDIRRLPNSDFLLIKTLASLIETYFSSQQWSKVQLASNEALMLLQKQSNNPEERIEYQKYKAQVLMSVGDAHRVQELYDKAIRDYQASAEAAQSGLTLIQSMTQTQNKQWLGIQNSLLQMMLQTACTQRRAVARYIEVPEQPSEHCKAR